MEVLIQWYINAVGLNMNKERSISDSRKYSRRRYLLALSLGCGLSFVLCIFWCALLIQIFWVAVDLSNDPLWVVLFLTGFSFIPIILAIGFSWWIASKVYSIRFLLATIYTFVTLFIMWLILNTLWVML